MIDRRQLLASGAAVALAGPTVAAPAARGASLIAGGKAAVVIADPGDWPGVLRAVQDLRVDLQKVAGQPATSPLPHKADGAPVVIAGTIGRCAQIDALIAAGKLDVTGVRGEWEAFVQQTVPNPMPGVAEAVVVAGSDKRGTIFGLYDLSAQAGVSPWWWWADVPVVVREDVWALSARNLQKPAVKHRGIFLNDEDPGLYSWVNGTFGGFNHAFYEKLYPLILRLKGNFLWPAMWGKSLWDDDPLSAELADEYGVVLGTSHHEPMVRSHVEWERYGEGPWDYAKNPERLRDFWRTGLERMGDKETLVTVGMRGDGDEPMTEGTATALLERIVADQRQIIGQVTGKPPAETPQVWALYKEVQDYYDKGMRVPDDVTLLFSDDNWGNIRRLPEVGAKRPGGYGVYYHFDYVGGPRNYKWLNTTQVARVWEQMKLARDYGADRLWIVNVGDLKPMELPISFFLDYAWDPEAWPLERLPQYTPLWAAQQFGPEHAVEIAALLDGYTRLNARRKPELLAPETFSLVHEREAERVIGEWDELERRALALGALLPKSQNDAYVQLVRWPIQACANLNRMYVAAGRNWLYARQNRLSANHWADQVKALFARDAELTRQFHDEIAGGKWRGLMSQTHIGYTSWQQPDRNIMPELRPTIAYRAAMPLTGGAVEGDVRAWPPNSAGAVLPILHPDGPSSRRVELFHGGLTDSYTVEASAPWLKVSPPLSLPDRDLRYEVSADWTRAPRGEHRATVTFHSKELPGRSFSVTALVSNPERRRRGFVEVGGQIAIEAAHYARAGGEGSLRWREIPGLGRTLSGVEAYPSTALASAPGRGPYLEYDVDLAAGGALAVEVTCAPTLDFRGKGGLRFAVSLDGGAPQVLTLPIDASQKAWEKAVSDYAVVVRADLAASGPGLHRLRLWRIDPGVVFERVTLVRGQLAPTYLGPRESVRR